MIGSSSRRRPGPSDFARGKNKRHWVPAYAGMTVLVAALAMASMPVLADEPEERAAALVAKMTRDEKIAQTMNAAPAIPRLRVPAYEWWNEGLHGVARSGHATVFPQAIGLAATWNTDLLE